MGQQDTVPTPGLRSSQEELCFCFPPEAAWPSYPAQQAQGFVARRDQGDLHHLWFCDFSPHRDNFWGMKEGAEHLGGTAGHCYSGNGQAGLPRSGWVSDALPALRPRLSMKRYVSWAQLGLLSVPVVSFTTLGYFLWNSPTKSTSGSHPATVSKRLQSTLIGKFWILNHSFLPDLPRRMLRWVSCGDSTPVVWFRSRNLLATAEEGVSQKRPSLSCVCLFIGIIFLFEHLGVLNEVLIEREMPFATLKIRNVLHISLNLMIVTIICMILGTDVSEHLFKHRWNQQQNCHSLN